MRTNDYKTILSHDLNVNSFAVALLRDGLIANLLKEDYPHITYWAGKELARQFPLSTLSDEAEFFNNAGFGELELRSQDSKKQIWMLRGALVDQRLARDRFADFSLEAGFLAQQLETQTGAIAEATFHFAKKHEYVEFEVITDLEQTVDTSDLQAASTYREHIMHTAHKESAEGATLITPTVDENGEPILDALAPQSSETSAITALEVEKTVEDRTREIPLSVKSFSDVAPTEPEATDNTATTTDDSIWDVNLVTSDAVERERAITDELLAFDLDAFATDNAPVEEEKLDPFNAPNIEDK